MSDLLLDKSFSVHDQLINKSLIPATLSYITVLLNTFYNHLGSEETNSYRRGLFATYICKGQIQTADRSVKHMQSGSMNVAVSE